MRYGLGNRILVKANHGRNIYRAISKFPKICIQRAEAEAEQGNCYSGLVKWRLSSPVKHIACASCYVRPTMNGTGMPRECLKGCLDQRVPQVPPGATLAAGKEILQAETYRHM